ncbi:MAG TPA: hypothetical protein VLF62_06555, partial [Candidatus Saccharimonadales bacterium]|nr:hypothetical protein [Candidatus Saccharimonadales bacterium]
MPETPPLLEDGTNGKKPKLLGDGRMPLRKQILLGIGGLVAVALIGVGLYIALHKPSYTANNTAKTSTIPNNATDDELPDSAPLTDIDDASLAQDLTSITGAVAVGESDDGTAGTVINDKTNEINIKTEAAAGEAAGNRLSRIKSAGDSEIARRLDALNRAITAVNGSPHLSAVNQDALSNEL